MLFRQSNTTFTVGSPFALDAMLKDPWVTLYLLKRDSLIWIKNQQLFHVLAC